MKFPRQRDERHLRALRALPCVICLRTPVEAAHIRFSVPNKPNPGIGARPSDRYALPLCPEHHAEQHRNGERKWWEKQGINPIWLATQLYRVSPNLDVMERLIASFHRVQARLTVD